MQVLTPLMAEHSFILRMIEVVWKVIEVMRESKEDVDSSLDRVIEFLCMYVDRCHQAKEEDIFFSRCKKKGIRETDRIVMRELIEEQVFIMRTVGELIEARRGHAKGSRFAMEIQLKKLELLITFFPEHIRKENEVFFPRVLKYFSHDEQYSIMREFWRFNERMPLEKYHALLDQLEASTGTASYPSIRLVQSL